MLFADVLVLSANPMIIFFQGRDSSSHRNQRVIITRVYN
jgi:hypothetical protein